MTIENIKKYLPDKNYTYEKIDHNKEYRHPGEHKIEWEKCKVGSKKGYKIDDDIRKNTFRAEAKPSFCYDRHEEKK